MAKFKVVIRPKEKRKDGDVNIKIRVYHRSKVGEIGTDYFVFPAYFNRKTGLVKIGGLYSKDEAERINTKILIKKGIMADKADRQRNLKNMDLNSLMDILKDKHREMDFFAIIDRRIEKLKKDGNINYAGLFRTTKNYIEEFAGVSILPFESIDYNFLVRMENSWRYNKDLDDSSIGFYMRNVRTIWNEGRKMGQVDASLNPFQNYKIPKGEPRENIVLTPTEMATIGKIEIKEPLMRWARDMAMLSFCLIGINPKDLFLAREIAGGRIYYKRSKGKKRYSIKIPPQALHIIKRYPGKKYLLNTMDRYADYRSATKRIDYKLKDIAEICEIDKEVILYTFRHSWSAYARYIGISKDDIAAALGHKQIELPNVTEWYDHIEEEQRRVDVANKKVIRLILRTPPKELPKE